MRRFRLLPSLLVALVLGALASPTFATGSGFDLGVDAGSLTTTAAANMGTILGVLFGVFIALVIFSAFWRWARRGVKGA